MVQGIKLIVGLGKSGLATADFLAQRSIPFAVTDTRSYPPNLEVFKQKHANAPISLGHLSADLMQKADEIIISPGLSLNEPLIKEQMNQGKKIIGDVELFLRYCKAPICAITGSNGKSTVTSLVYEMAKTAQIPVKIGGNIGIPILQLLAGETAELYVLELSSFQLETTFSLKAKAATILNISADHMDRYENLAEYTAAKQRIYNHCDVAVINRDDKATWIQQYKPKSEINFGLDVPDETSFGLIHEKGKTFLAYGNEKLIAGNDLYLSGKHHWQNALAALALGKACHIPFESMLATLKSFKGLRHRCQLIKQYQDVKWFNDSKGTNEGATLAAIESVGSSIKGKVILIAGGLAKGADFEILKQPVKNYVSHVILLGEAAEQLQTVFHKLSQIHLVTDLKEAVRLANKLSKPTDAVLLSPACASFDMFENFEKRGEIFEELVKENIQ